MHLHGVGHQLSWVLQVPPGCGHRTDPGDVTEKVLSPGTGAKRSRGLGSRSPGAAPRPALQLPPARSASRK